MTSETILTQFELQVDDTTNLSDSEEYTILNRVYNKVCNYRPWEFLKKKASGTMSSDSTSYYITTPSDFAYFTENNLYTDNSTNINNNAAPKVIFIGSNYEPYQIINWSDRRQYLNKIGYAYIDISDGKIRFTGTPSSTTYEFDYIKIPTTLAAGVTPDIPTRFLDILVFGMAVDDTIIQRSPKAESYIGENQSKYQSMLDDMSYWNAQLINY